LRVVLPLVGPRVGPRGVHRRPGVLVRGRAALAVWWVLALPEHAPIVEWYPQPRISLSAEMRGMGQRTV
jgi:hypothetical protein